MKRKKKGKKMLQVKCDVDVDVAFGVEGWEERVCFVEE
jgi:hypothetical protein